jgi:hypothetical protein
MDAKTIFANFARSGLKYLAGALVLHGWINSGNVESFIGLGMVALTYAWSFWNDYGRVIANASLDILRAKVLNAAAAARANPSGAVAAVAKLEAHVMATTATAVAASAPAAPLILLMIGLCALASGWASPARAQGKLTGNPLRDIGNAAKGEQQQAIAARNESTEDLVAKLGKLALPDFEFALALSKATNNVVSTPCWQAWVALLTAQQKPLVGTDGQPVTEPDPHLATSVEKISELLGALRPDSTLSTGCAALAAAGGKDAATLIQGILSGGALGLFKLPVPIGPIP